MQSANAVKTPLPKTVDLLPAHENEDLLDEFWLKKYGSMIGSLLYLAICTRPDISFSVAALVRQVHAPTSRHLALVKRIMSYVAATVDVGLLYPRSRPVLSQSLCASVLPIGSDAKRLGIQPLVG